MVNYCPLDEAWGSSYTYENNESMPKKKKRKCLLFLQKHDFNIF